MTRNLKTPGFALLAVFALSAVVASGASAQTGGVVTTENGSATTFDGAEVGEKENYFEDPTLGSKIECPGSTTTGHKLAVTPHERIPNKSSSVTVTPKFINCNSGGLLVTITMNGCDYGATLGETTAGEPNEFAVTEHIVCPEGKKIEMHVYSSKTSEAIPTCTYTMGSQTITGAFDIANDPGTPDAVVVTGKATEIKTERHGLCGNKTELFNTTQALHGTTIGTDELGESQGITVTH